MASSGPDTNQSQFFIVSRALLANPLQSLTLTCPQTVGSFTLVIVRQLI